MNLKKLQVEQVNKFTPYLKEIKKRLVFSFSIFIATMVFGFVFYEDIIKFLVKGLSLEGINIVFTSPFQFINLAISCGVATGLIITFPLVLYQLLMFIKPALKNTEFNIVIKYIPFSIALFVIGFVFGAIIMKWQIDIFLQSSVNIGIGNILDISKLLSTILLTSTFLGVGFQFPIILLVLGKLDIITKKTLAKYRSWIYIASFMFAILLPVDSIIADIFLSLPLIVLFELTLLMM